MGQDLAPRDRVNRLARKDALHRCPLRVARAADTLLEAIEIKVLIPLSERSPRFGRLHLPDLFIGEKSHDGRAPNVVVLMIGVPGMHRRLQSGPAAEK